MPRKSLHSSINNLSYKSLLIILFFLLISIVVLWKFVLPNHKVEASWWNDGWNYRKAISISNTSGSNLTDFQMSISIGTSALIASGKMQSDCDDIRITDINGNLLPYWIEPTGPNSCNQVTDTRIWIKNSSIPTSGTTIFIYYGNPSASTASSGANTFIYFKNNFQTSDLGWNWSNGGVESGWAKTWATGADNPGSTMTWIKNIINITGQEVVVEFTVKATKSGATGHDTTNVLFNPTQTTALYNNTNNSTIANGSGNSIITFGDYSGWYGKVGLDTTTGQASNITNDTAYPTYQFNTDGWVRHVHKLTNSSLLLSGYSLGGLSVGTSAWTYNEKTVTSGYTKPNNIILAIGEQFYESIWMREAFVRKYASTEPTATIQSEEAGGGPIAYWKFDEGSGTTAYDSTSNQNNGTLGTGNSAPTWADESQCISGKCLSFNGLSSTLQSSNSNSLNISGSEITLSAWIKINNCTDANAIIHKNSQYSIALYPNGNTCQLTYADSSNWSYANFGKYGSITKNTWHHVSVTKNSSNIVTLYLDGKVLTSKSFGSSITSNLNPVYIGSYKGGTTDYYMNGFIDEPKIYSYSRTADQIKQDYNSRGSSKGTTANLGGAGSDNNLSDGLVGYWKMDEGIGTTTADSSGNLNTGTLTNTGWINGKFGIGTSFNGTNAYISLGQIKSIGAETYSFWFKSTSTSTGHVILATNATTSNYGISRIGDNLLFLRSGSNYQYFNNIAQYYDGQWHHLVITVPGGSQSDITNTKAYVDNKEMTKGSGTSSVAPGAYSNFYIATGSYGYFNGSIDEVRIYNRALSPAEVSQLYEFAPGPIGYWDFEENTGTTIKDKSGNGNTGTLYNSPTWTTGKIGSAINLNGTTQYADITTLSSAIQGYGTFEMWIKPNDCSATNQSIFSQRYISHGRGIRIGSNIISAWSRNSSGTWQEVILGSCINNQWQHAALVQEGNIIKGYLNGVFKNSLNMTSSLDGSYVNYYTLGKYTNSGYFFDGTVDEVKLYNYARTQKQIIEDMSATGRSASGRNAIAYYKFDEGSGTTANNLNQNTTISNGILENGPTWTNQGKFNKGVLLDGLNDYIQISNNSSLKYTGNDLSFSLWYKPDSSSDNGWVISKPWNGSGQYNYYIQKSGTSLNFHLEGSSSYNLSFGQSIITNNWNHITVSINGSTNQVKLYINGRLTNFGTNSITNWTPSSGDNNLPLALGTLYPYGGSWSGVESHAVSGLIDEVKIYNYALTDDEVKQDYNQGSALQMGQTSQTIGGTTTSLEYCIPGDTSYCASPVAEWNFEENTGTTAKDSSGNNNNGTISGATWTTGANNKGAALNFNGSSDYVSIPDSSASLSSNFTVSFWVKPNDDSNNPRWFSLIDGSNNLQIGHMGTDEKVYFRFADSAIETITGITLNQWTFITCKMESGTRKIFFNGIEQTTESGGITSNATYSAIGGGFPNYTANGKIDGVKIYNYARTPAQIAYDYNKGGPIGWWKFDECQGSTVYDSSGVGNTGVIVIGSSGTQNSLGTCQIGTSAAWTNGASGKINSSLNFDGNDDYVSINDNDVLDPSQITISAWVKPSSLSNSGNFIGKGDNSGYRMRIYSDGSIGFLDRGSTNGLVTATGVCSVGNWYHIVGVGSSNGLKIYLNGKLLTQNSTAYGGPNTSSPLKIGLAMTSEYFQGQIDDVRIYNYALTPEQVKTLYNGGAVSFN